MYIKRLIEFHNERILIISPRIIAIPGIVDINVNAHFVSGYTFKYFVVAVYIIQRTNK